MSSTKRFIRRNRVDERLALAIAVLSGVAASFSPASPTGTFVTDAIVLFVAVGAVTWASTSAPWWAIAGYGAAVAAIAFDPIVAVVGVFAFLGGLHIGTMRRDDSEMRAIAGALAVNASLWSQLDGFFALSAIIGITLGVAVAVVGWMRRPSSTRTAAARVVAGVGIGAVIAVIGLVLALVDARSDVTAAGASARRGVTQLDSGDYTTAATTFRRSASEFDGGSSSLGGFLAMPARLIPGVAQNLRAARELSDVAATATADAAVALGQVDPSAIALQGGGFDIDAIRAVEEPLTRVRASLLQLDDVSQRVKSPWLLDRLAEELETLDMEIGDNGPRLDNAIEAVRLAPDLLGADGERRYLVLFTSPGESRGAVGFFGNWAELTAVDGRLSLAEFGRTGTLNGAIAANGSDCETCPEEFLTYYGQYGFTTGEGGSVGDVPWSNVTIAAHFPYAAATIASMYPDSGGRPIDGVIAMDPYVLAQLMEYTGPIDVPELDVTVASADAAEFLLVEQYSLAQEKGTRVEALETLGREAITRILTSDLPDPPTLAAAFGPLVEERRLVMWTTEASERGFLDRIGMLGGLPTISSVDGGFGMTVTNATANKIDSFLERTVDVTERTGSDGGRELVADVTLTNNAPLAGLPPYVIGNPIDLPTGTTRLIVTFFGPAAIRDVTMDGEELAVGTLTEAGWFGYRTVVEIPSSGSVSYQIVFALPPVDGTGTGPVVWTQPLRR